jgi:3-oxoacyl-[acyl-carrier protein] reductase
LIKRREGHIFNVSSGPGVIGLTEPPPYICSKFAVVGLSEAIFGQLSIFNIHVSVVIPSYIKTDIYLKSELRYPQKLIEDLGEKK